MFPVIFPRFPGNSYSLLEFSEGRRPEPTFDLALLLTVELLGLHYEQTASIAS